MVQHNPSRIGRNQNLPQRTPRPLPLPHGSEEEDDGCDDETAGLHTVTQGLRVKG